MTISNSLIIKDGHEIQSQEKEEKYEFWETVSWLVEDTVLQNLGHDFHRNC